MTREGCKPTPEARVVVDEEPLPTEEWRLMFIAQKRCDITYESSSPCASVNRTDREAREPS